MVYQITKPQTVAQSSTNQARRLYVLLHCSRPCYH